MTDRRARLQEVENQSRVARKPATALFTTPLLPAGAAFNVGAAMLYAGQTGRTLLQETAASLRARTTYTGTDDLPAHTDAPVVMIDAAPQPIVIDNNRLVADAPDAQLLDVLVLPARLRPYITLKDADTFEQLPPATGYGATLDLTLPSGRMITYWLGALPDLAAAQAYLKVVLTEYLRLPMITSQALAQVQGALNPLHPVALPLDEPPYNLVLTITPGAAFRPLNSN